MRWSGSYGRPLRPSGRPIGRALIIDEAWPTPATTGPPAEGCERARDRSFGRLVVGVAVLGTGSVARAYFLDSTRNFDVRLRAYSQIAVATESSRDEDSTSLHRLTITRTVCGKRRPVISLT